MLLLLVMVNDAFVVRLLAVELLHVVPVLILVVS